MCCRRGLDRREKNPQHVRTSSLRNRKTAVSQVDGTKAQLAGVLGQQKQRPSVASEGVTMNVLEHIAFIAIVCVLSLIVIVGDGGEHNRRPLSRRRR